MLGGGVVDVNTGTLEPAYRRAVAAALPAKVDPPPEFWAGLADAAAGYFMITRGHQSRARDLPRMQQIAALIDALDVDQLALDQRFSPALRQEASRTLIALRDRVEVHILAGSTASAFKGRRNPHHALLFGALLDLWRGLRLPLGYSQGARGPLIRYLLAAAGPILGDDMPKVRTLGAIIDRERLRLVRARARSS
jgi:hypothetical protein